MSTSIACTNMIKQQLRTGDVLEPSILALFDSIPRDAFVPAAFKPFAYSDLQITLPHKQRMMTPLEEALLLQSLALTGHETVLEIGTGTGFLTALLSRLAKKVISVDYYADFTNQARSLLTEQQCNNVELITGDAAQGWLDLAPYDVIVFTASLPALSQMHCLQVLPGGKLFAILGEEPLMQAKLFSFSKDKQWSEQVLFETNIPPLINRFTNKSFVF